jgi:hypothetical protein
MRTGMNTVNTQAPTILGVDADLYDTAEANGGAE